MEDEAGAEGDDGDYSIKIHSRFGIVILKGISVACAIDLFQFLVTQAKRP